MPRRSEYLQRVVLGVICASATAMTVYAFHVAVSAPLWDFQWSGAHLLVHGRDPYREFLKFGSGAFVGTQFPNYSPLLYLILAPFGLASLAWASWAWTTLNVAFAVVAAWLIGRYAGLTGTGVVALSATFLSSLPYYDAVSKGQQTLLVLLAAAISVTSRHPMVIGSALAVMLTKYSFAPIVLLHVAQHRWRALIVAGVIQLLALGVFSALTGSGSIDVALGPLKVARTMYPGSGSVFTLASLAGLEGGAPLVVTGAVAVALAYAGRAVLSADGLAPLAFAALVSLATFPHLLYDYCFLLPVAAVGAGMRGWIRLLVLAPVMVLWFPWMVGGFLPYALPWVLVVLGLSLGSIFALIAAFPRTVPSRS